MAEQYTIYGVDLGGTMISGVEDHSIQTNVQHAILRGDGSAYPTSVIAMFADPRLRFTSESIAALLTKLTVGGYQISTAVNLWSQKMSELGRASGSVHEKHTIAAGVVLPIELDVRQDGVARMTGLVVPSYDGTNDLIVTAAAALSGSPIISEVFTLGPGKINNTAIGALKSLNVNFGITVTADRSDGEGKARNLVLATQDPVIRFTSGNAALLRSLGLYGTYGGANTTFFLTRCKGSDTTMRYANNESQHISLTCRGRVHISDLGGDPQIATGEVIVAKESAVALLTAATTATIA